MGWSSRSWRSTIWQREASVNSADAKRDLMSAHGEALRGICRRGVCTCHSREGSGAVLSVSQEAVDSPVADRVAVRRASSSLPIDRRWRLLNPVSGFDVTRGSACYGGCSADDAEPKTVSLSHCFHSDRIEVNEVESGVLE